MVSVDFGEFVDKTKKTILISKIMIMSNVWSKKSTTEICTKIVCKFGEVGDQI